MKGHEATASSSATAIAPIVARPRRRMQRDEPNPSIPPQHGGYFTAASGHCPEPVPQLAYQGGNRRFPRTPVDLITCENANDLAIQRRPPRRLPLLCRAPARAAVVASELVVLTWWPNVAEVRLHCGGGASHVTGSKQVEERATKHGKQEGSLGGPPSGATQPRGLRGGENIQPVVTVRWAKSAHGPAGCTRECGYIPRPIMSATAGDPGVPASATPADQPRPIRRRFPHQPTWPVHRRGPGPAGPAPGRPCCRTSTAIPAG